MDHDHTVGAVLDGRNLDHSPMESILFGNKILSKLNAGPILADAVDMTKVRG
jgi:hypothetical protein